MGNQIRARARMESWEMFFRGVTSVFSIAPSRPLKIGKRVKVTASIQSSWEKTGEYIRNAYANVSRQ